MAAFLSYSELSGSLCSHLRDVHEEQSRPGSVRKMPPSLEVWGLHRRPRVSEGGRPNCTPLGRSTGHTACSVTNTGHSASAALAF